MARGMPSLAALLGLIAVAGYQNRDKIGDFVKGLGNADRSNPGGGMLDSVKNSFGDSPLAKVLRPVSEHLYNDSGLMAKELQQILGLSMGLIPLSAILSWSTLWVPT